VIRRWNAFWFAPALPDRLGFCRVLFFGLWCLQLAGRDFSAWPSYSDGFWMPIWLFDRLHLPLLSAEQISWVQFAWKGSLLLSAIGLFARTSMIAAFLGGVYLIGLPHNFGQSQDFDSLMVLVCGVLAVSRAGDAVSADAWIAQLRDRPEPDESWEYTWPVRFVWVAIALIFCAAGISKLRQAGLDSILSENFALLLRQHYHISDAGPSTAWSVWLASHARLMRALAALALATETLYPLALCSRRARMLIVPAGFALLLGVRLLIGAGIEQFMICYVFWVPWHRLTYNAGVYAAPDGNPARGIAPGPNPRLATGH
jgi:hypothetical protein